MAYALSPASYQPVYELTRDGIVESVHYGAIAVADASGRLYASFGDPNLVTYLRSSAKPFQAIPLLESGAAEHYGFTPREIALACASHMGQDIHSEAVSVLQAKIGISEGDLLCGQHPVEGHPPRPNRHNCSGKHTGMLAHAKYRHLPLAEYVDPNHDIQKGILAVFAELCGLQPAEVVLGIDGCSAPNFAVSLQHAATAFARLADPSGLAPHRAKTLNTIFSAMNSYPEMVRGEGGFDTELMRLLPGKVVSKFGAEAYHGLALAPGALGTGSPALGVALKISDGAFRAAEPMALEVLRQLGAVTAQHIEALSKFNFDPHHPIKNWREVVVGEARTCFTLKQA